MRRLLIAAAAGVPLAAAVYLPSASADTGSSASTTTPLKCSSITLQAPEGTEVERVTAVDRPAGTVDVPAIPPLLASQVPDVPAHCDVTVTLTHPGQSDHAQVKVWLPTKGWNGRLQTLGGSAFAAGDYGTGLATAVKNGYAAATTDAGVKSYLDTSWALDGAGKVNKTLLKNFASRSEHEAAVVAKRVISGYYDKSASYAYFNGCSTGGRQGYAEAQAYPDDYDGILANAPAINWDEFEVATLWPQVVMNSEKTYPTGCEFDAFNAAAVKACDTLDGVKDGLVEDPSRCGYDPRRLIGTTLECDGKQVTITAADAAVVRKIWDGPRTTSGKKLWSGVPIGADLKFPNLAGTQADADGNLKGAPFPVPADWVSSWLEKQPSFDVSTITYGRFTQLFRQSQAEYDKVIGTDAPDLSAFRKSGGKLLTWHGQADQLIPTQGTVSYRQQVERKMGGAKRVDDFYRLFLAPGTAHCGLIGQTDDLGALRAWVEHGKTPRTLTATLTNASGEQITRDLCSYPQVSRYRGHGDPADADSFRCVSPSRH
ncbi:tannase/feruloyl esterase family alpha/beta hydrolase [Streptomyces sp. NPDC097727]|uniref:tannase/feruloyl esterase family alpha/beta hydrolase n=1 Tax=Streptomyces sp. NPDC097727 TaxID=3366092 RepID=UPI0037F2033B